MSLQHPKHAQEQQAQAATGGGAGGTTTAAPKEPTPIYKPLDVPAGAEWAEVQSRQLSDIAAGKPPAQLGVQVPEGSLDYPLAMYNQKDGTVKAAKDEKEKSDLASKGYGENPPPAGDPNIPTPEMMQALQDLWSKAGDALKKLTLLMEQQQKQKEAAGNTPAAGQQPPAAGQHQQQQHPNHPPTASH